jgi:hypothetical protein
VLELCQLHQRPPVGSAEYMQLSRRQLQNNKKAITDALNDFISGKTSQVFTETMLSTYGLSVETIKRLLSDAGDGRIDDPDLKDG